MNQSLHQVIIMSLGAPFQLSLRDSVQINTFAGADGVYYIITLETIETSPLQRFPEGPEIFPQTLFTLSVQKASGQGVRRTILSRQRETLSGSNPTMSVDEFIIQLTE